MPWHKREGLKDRIGQYASGGRSCVIKWPASERGRGHSSLTCAVRSRQKSDSEAEASRQMPARVAFRAFSSIVVVEFDRELCWLELRRIIFRLQQAFERTSPRRNVSSFPVTYLSTSFHPSIRSSQSSRAGLARGFETCISWVDDLGARNCSTWTGYRTVQRRKKQSTTTPAVVIDCSSPQQTADSRTQTLHSPFKFEEALALPLPLHVKPPKIRTKPLAHT